METKDWITLGAALLSALLLIASWFIISWLNRRNEIAKERMRFRLDILFSILDRCDEAQRLVVSNGIDVKDKTFSSNLLVSLRRMYLFGSTEEASVIDSIFNKMKEGKPIGNDLNTIQYNTIQDIVVMRLKRELGITK